MQSPETTWRSARMVNGKPKEKPVADEVDVANSQIEKTLALTLAAAKSSVTPLPYIGMCHNCEEPIKGKDQRRFCDKDCLDDYQKRVLQSKNAGRPLAVKTFGNAKKTHYR